VPGQWKECGLERLCPQKVVRDTYERKDHTSKAAPGGGLIARWAASALHQEKKSGYVNIETTAITRESSPRSRTYASKTPIAAERTNIETTN
jgi:hypothetical protein